MRRVKVAVATRVFDLPLKQAVYEAAKTGASGVQFDAWNELNSVELSQTGRRQLVKYLSDYDLSVASLYLPFKRALYDLTQLEQRLDLIRHTMKLAFDLRSGVVTLRVGPVPDKEKSPDTYSLLIELLDDLARYGNHVGAVLAVTPVCEPPELLLEVLEQVKQGPIGVDFDPTVYVAGDWSAIDVFKQVHQKVQHVLVHDAVRDIDGTVEEVPVGRGDVTWDELLVLIDHSGYTGWLTVVRNAGEDKSGDCARAVQYIRNVMAEL